MGLHEYVWIAVGSVPPSLGRQSCSSSAQTSMINIAMWMLQHRWRLRQATWIQVHLSPWAQSWVASLSCLYLNIYTYFLHVSLSRTSVSVCLGEEERCSVDIPQDTLKWNTGSVFQGIISKVPCALKKKYPTKWVKIPPKVNPNQGVGRMLEEAPQCWMKILHVMILPPSVFRGRNPPKPTGVLKGHRLLDWIKPFDITKGNFVYSRTVLLEFSVKQTFHR